MPRADLSPPSVVPELEYRSGRFVFRCGRLESLTRKAFPRRAQSLSLLALGVKMKKERKTRFLPEGPRSCGGAFISNRQRTTGQTDRNIPQSCK